MDFIICYYIGPPKLCIFSLLEYSLNSIKRLQSSKLLKETTVVLKKTSSSIVMEITSRFNLKIIQDCLLLYDLVCWAKMIDFNKRTNNKIKPLMLVLTGQCFFLLWCLVYQSKTLFSIYVHNLYYHSLLYC